MNIFSAPPPLKTSSDAAPDKKTADAFSTSWNTLPPGSVYTKDQVVDWLAPLSPDDFKDKDILELGCGGGSLLVHILDFEPRKLVGVDLGDSILAATRNLVGTGKKNWEIIKQDLCVFKSNGFDIVYCIGVLHHLKNPYQGFLSVLQNTKQGGDFHCWVYGYEGNFIIRTFVEPLRKVCSKLPWQLIKYAVATPLVFPYYLYAKTLRFLPESIARKFPIGPYSLWIAKRDFLFFRHVAFDQLVTPQTTYIKKETLDAWLTDNEQIDQTSTYIVQRNGNSWKFGGRKISRPLSDKETVQK